MSANELDDEERAALWEQYATASTSAQETFDSSFRTLAAAGLAVTVSLATAIDDLNVSGDRAVVLFLGSLLANLLSYATLQIDLRRRLKAVEIGTREGSAGNRWTILTHILNAAAGITLIAAGVFLARFVGSSV